MADDLGKIYRNFNCIEKLFLILYLSETDMRSDLTHLAQV